MIYTCYKDKAVIKSVVLLCKSCRLAFHPKCIKYHNAVNDKGELVPCTAGYSEIDQKTGKIRDYNQQDDGVTPMETSTENSSARKRRRTDDDANDEELLRALIQNCMRQEVSPLITKIDELQNEIMESKNEIIALKQTVAKLTNENSLLLQKSNINSKVNVENVSKSASVYANVARKKNAETVLVVKPVTDDITQQGDATKKGKKNENLKNVKSNINVKELGIGVKSIKEKNNGTVVLKLNNVNDKEKLQKKVADKIGDQFKVQAPKVKKKFVKIVYIDSDETTLTDEQLINDIVKQNDLKDCCEKIEIKIVKRIVNNKKSDFSVIAEVNPELQKVLLFMEKISLGWKQCKVIEHLNVSRCFKCCGYNHYAKECKRELACGKCGDAHSTKTCEKTDLKCTNCAHKNKKKNNNDKVDDKHNAFDKKCPIYIKIAESYKKREIENI